MYLIKEYRDNIFELQLEDLHDLLKIRKILEGASLYIFKKIRSEKVPQLTKDKRKILLKKIIYQNLKITISGKKLHYMGLTAEGYRSDYINSTQKIIFKKKLKRFQRDFLKLHKRKQLLFFSYQVGRVIVGKYQNHVFKEMRTHYHNFKEVDLKKYIPNILKKYEHMGFGNFIFKTHKTLIETLKEATNLNWVPFNKDITIEWSEYCVLQKTYEKWVQKLGRTSEKLICKSKIDILEALETNNISEILFNEQIDPIFYKKIESILEQEKIKYIPFTKRLEYYLPLGIVILKYF